MDEFTCYPCCLGLLLGYDGVTKVTQVLQAPLDVQVGGQPGNSTGENGKVGG